MKYLATVIKDRNFNQIDDNRYYDSLENLCYNYQLIFVSKEHAIIFFNFRVMLDQLEYDVLYNLGSNATSLKEEKGLSALKLFKLAKCKHTREKSRNSSLTEEDRADERIRDIKRRIKKDILKTYNELKDTNELSKIGIYSVQKSYPQQRELYFNGSILVDENSPYNDFEINSAIKSLIYNQKDKNKKYTTVFSFK